MTKATMTFAELKKYLKSNAIKIKELKSTRKAVPCGYVAGLDDLRKSIRHYHIAYCMIRGRSIDEIEKPAAGNEHNEHWVKQIIAMIVFPPKKEIMEVQDEKIVCDCP